MTTITYGTLGPLPADMPCEVTLVRRALSSEAVTGFVAVRTLRQNVSRQTGQPQTRVWRLTFGPYGGESTLLNGFDAGRGGAVPVLWTPPPPDDSGGAIPVRFVDGTLRVRRLPGALFAAEVELEEVA